MNEINGRSGVLARAFDILACFASHPERSIADLCAATDLPPATVHRMLAKLAEHGAIERAGRGRYRLGSRLWRLGHGVPDIRTLRDCARPALVDLHTSTRLPVALATRDGDHLHIIDKIAGSSTERAWESLGRPRLEENPGGWVLLAWGALDEQGPMPRPHDVKDDFTWRQQLAAARRIGFAHTQQESPGDQGLVWAASPVFAEDQRVATCVMIGGVRGKHPAPALGRLARTAARAISSRMREMADDSTSGAHG